MKKTFTNIVSGVLTIALMAMYMPSIANAAPANTLSDNMDRQKVSEAATHVITFTLPTALGASDTVVVTFPGAFTGTAATGSTDWSATGSNEVTFTDSGSGQSASTVYSVTVTGLINPSSAANYVIDIVGDNGDIGEITVPIITDDQIQITAKVDQTLFFDVRDTTGGGDDNAVGFGSLSSTASRWATDDGTGSGVATDSSEFEAATNAAGGYTVAVAGTTLTSGSDTIDALGTAATPSTGTEQFGIAVSNGAGSGHGTIDGNYTGGTYYLNTAAEDDIVSTTAASVNSTYDVSYVANITAATEPGNYAATLTFTMTTNF